MTLAAQAADGSSSGMNGTYLDSRSNDEPGSIFNKSKDSQTIATLQMPLMIDVNTQSVEQHGCTFGSGGTYENNRNKYVQSNSVHNKASSYKMSLSPVSARSKYIKLFAPKESSNKNKQEYKDIWKISDNVLIPFDKLYNPENLQNIDLTYFLTKSREILKHIYDTRFKLHNDFKDLKDQLTQNEYQQQVLQQVFYNNKGGEQNK